jgi:hypothetical protein
LWSFVRGTDLDAALAPVGEGAPVAVLDAPERVERESKLKKVARKAKPTEENPEGLPEIDEDEVEDEFEGRDRRDGRIRHGSDAGGTRGT